MIKISSSSGSINQIFYSFQFVKLFKSVLLKVEIFILCNVWVDKSHAEALKANLDAYVNKATSWEYLKHIKNLN